MGNKFLLMSLTQNLKHRNFKILQQNFIANLRPVKQKSISVIDSEMTRQFMLAAVLATLNSR